MRFLPSISGEIGSSGGNFEVVIGSRDGLVGVGRVDEGDWRGGGGGGGEEEGEGE